MLMRSMVLLFACSCLAPAWAEESAVEADLVLVGGTIVDGSGAEPFAGDVAIQGDQIVAVGVFTAVASAERVDCTGQVVAPGFIDLHNHSDFARTESDNPTVADLAITQASTRSAANYLTQGCTTIVTGNCGGGAIDVAAYYDYMAENPPGVNVAQLIPQGALRNRVMGKVRRAATEEELTRMESIAHEAMLAGAWGMSTGLQYVPSSYADTNELVRIAKVVHSHGGIYASHMRDEGDELLEAIDETIEIGRRARLPVHVSHFKSSKRRNWGKVRAAARRIEEARAEGLRVTADQYPYNASSTGIDAMLLPDGEREGGTAATVARLKSAEEGPRLREMVAANLEARGPIMIASIKDHPTWVGKLLTEVAQNEGMELIDVAWEVLLTGGAAGVSFSMDENDVRYVMTLPYVATASDGSTKIDDGSKPHPRSFGTFPRKIGRYALGEGAASLETAVRSCSGLPADILGLEDRGYLEPGFLADVVVFNPEELMDRATFESPFEVSVGVERVIVNGRTAVIAGEFQDEYAGRPLRRVSVGK